ncbi:hypothetical protein RP15_gp189 [Staphylococcus phage vB_Sau-RP15]|nr:hypothetical protein RP15_gp189 [Staphylococcus phage vB_Sau-RP15]
MRKKTHKEFIKEVYTLVGEEYTVLTEYELSSKKLLMRHNKCSNEYWVRPNLFLKGGRCPNCHGNKAKHKTTTQYKKEDFDLVGDEYTVLEDYINRATPILMRHNKCGREYKVSPGNFLYHSRCIACYYQSQNYNILIEYQGEQHFKPKTFGGISKELAKERFKKQQVNDKIKNKFAKDNDFVLWEPTYKINTYSSMKSYLDKKFSLIEVKQGNI